LKNQLQNSIDALHINSLKAVSKNQNLKFLQGISESEKRHSRRNAWQTVFYGLPWVGSSSNHNEIKALEIGLKKSIDELMRLKTLFL